MSTNTSALIPDVYNVNVNQGQAMNALEVPKKNIFDRERDAASSALSSDFINDDTVGYEIEITDACSEQLRISVECNDNADIPENPVTHIEIVKEIPLQQSEVLQSKPGLSRRVTGANRVVPFITSLWQKGELKAFEPTVYSVYKAILNNPENAEERLCEICHNEFLSSTEVEAHLREIHRKEYIMPQQCFVCTKMYVFESQLERHLSISHGIQYPEMICKICFMEFNTAIEKKAHERKHDKIYTCHLCSSKFASEYSWQKHYTEHLIAKKPYQCTKCGKRFCQRICLALHKRRHGRCWCSLCHSFFNELQFLLHLENHLPVVQRNFLNSIEKMDQEESHFEEVMNTYFQTKSSCLDSWKFKEVDQDVSGCVDSMVNAVSNVLEMDLQPSELLQKNGVECKLCGLEMSSATELLEHRRKSHLRSRTCPFCGKRSRSVSQTFRHMKTHIGKRKSNKGVTQSSKKDINETENVFECQLCNRVFPNKGKQNYHLETIHKMNIVSRPYSCTVCDRKFQYKAARDRHMLVHSKEKNACWKCAVCDQAFLRPKFLLRHVKEHEAENVCHVCNKTFSKKAKLTLHLKSHNPFIPRNRLKCSLCPVSSLSITTLREHIRIHTGERPYSCDQCELKFKRSQALKQHLISIHNGPGSTSYVCSLCAVVFNRRGNLMRHILSYHQGVRRFICGLCGNRYGQKQDLRRHLSTKHQMQLANIPVMEKKTVKVYVYPPLEALPSSDAQYINIIIAEEGLKIQQLLALESDTNSSTDIEHTIPFKSTVQVPSLKPVSRQQNVTIQSKEFSESLTNKGSVTLVQDHSYIPLLSFHICTQCNNVIFRKYQRITDHENNSSSCEQCCNLREELPVQRVEPMVVEPGIVITEQGRVSLENLSSNNSEAAINDRLINEVLTTEFEEYLYENIASLMNPDLDGASDQIPIQNVMLQSSSAMLPLKFSNENLLMATSNPPSITIQPANNNSMLTNNSSTPAANLPLNNLSSLKIDGTLPPFTSPEISAETDNYKSNKSSEEQNNDDISAGTANKKAYPEAVGLPLNNLRSLKMDGALPPFTSPETSAENDSYKSNKSSKEEKNDDITVDVANKRAYPEIGCSADPLPQISHISFAPNDATKSNIYDRKIYKKKCDQKSALESHIKVHSGDTSFKCETCERPFKLKHNLIVHSRTHTGERRYECLQCSKCFRYHKDLLNHEKKHQGLRPYLCAECGKQFLRHADLKRHGDIHSNKWYQCPVCHKLFKRLDHMKMVHMKTHEKTSAKVFECEQCKKKFSSRFALRKHRLLHSGMKTHNCTKCDKSFVLKMYLESHMKMHERQENYVQCPRCPRKFVSESTCQIHISKFHRVNVNVEEVQQITNTNTDTAMGYSASTVINTEFDFVNTEGKNCDSLEDQPFNAVIYIQMFVENEVPLHDELQ